MFDDTNIKIPITVPSMGLSQLIISYPKLFLVKKWL